MGRDWVNKLSNKRIDSSHLWKTKEKEYKGTDFGKLLGVVEVCAMSFLIISIFTHLWDRWGGMVVVERWSKYKRALRRTNWLEK